MKKYIFVFTVLISTFILTAFALPNGVNDETYTEYCNLRFDYCLNYPGEELKQQESSDNGDGVVFATKDGKVTMTIVGSYNIMQWSPQDIYLFTFEDELNDPNIFVENIETEMNDNGFEARYNVDGEYWYYKMYLLDDAYVMLHLQSEFEDFEMVEALIPQMGLELSI